MSMYQYLSIVLKRLVEGLHELGASKKKWSSRSQMPTTAQLPRPLLESLKLFPDFRELKLRTHRLNDLNIAPPDRPSAYLRYFVESKYSTSLVVQNLRPRYAVSTDVSK